MGTTTALKQLLESLCHDSCWNYALVWKLRQGSPVILTWEDGYFDYPEPRKPVVNMLDGVPSHVLQSEVSSSNCSYEETQIGTMAVDMSHLQYVFGEGVVGEVAFTRNHCWVSFSKIFGDEIHPELVSQCPDEWLLQFASGIKTILLVPILPHGVLQLGSYEEVPEDTEMVAFIKCRLNSLFDTFNVPSTVAINLVKSEDLYPYMELDIESSPETFEDERGNKGFSPSDIFPELSPIESMDPMELEMVETKLFELSCLMEELQTYSDCNNDYAGGVFGESLDSIMTAYSSEDVEWKPTEFMAANTVTDVLIFPQDCELHNALGSSFWSQTHENPWDTSFLECPNHSDHSNKAGSPWVVEGCYAEYLLEPMVTNLYSGSDDNSSDMCDNSKSTSSPRSPTTSQAPSNTGASTLVEDESGPGSQDAVTVTRGTSSNAAASFMKDNMLIMFDEEHDGQESNHIHSRKEPQISNSRKRAKPGKCNNHKPRPRDRQLIQDRVKELRELVPNATKCSIDGLLDQTIKHMLYLSSVTEQAQKLGDWVDNEVSSRKDQRSCEAKEDGQTGTSLAFEFGSELQLWPIVVEDLLTHPGHMLIEMVCNDHSLFLEIAQVIRDLQLTVLKGVMESRSNKTWAHFIVEVCKGFQRLDIFWPLMQLLQRKTKPISSKI